MLWLDEDRQNSSEMCGKGVFSVQWFELGICLHIIIEQHQIQLHKFSVLNLGNAMCMKLEANS